VLWRVRSASCRANRLISPAAPVAAFSYGCQLSRLSMQAADGGMVFVLTGNNYDKTYRFGPAHL
jgi:hypothetical protein